MKTSHFTTPRTLADCEFQTWADPLEAPCSVPWQLNEMLLTAAVVALGLLGLLVSSGA